MSEDMFRHDDYDTLLTVAKRRRSVRKFEPGREVSREILQQIMEIGRWAPSGANTQPWEFICVHDPAQRLAVREVFLKQAERLRTKAARFPAVRKEYMANTVAIIVVLGDPRWKASFPQGHPDVPQYIPEYDQNNEQILLASMGAAIQMLHLGVASFGLTSAWLSGGGEATTNKELSELLGYPEHLVAYGTIPIGYPAKDVSFRYRRPLSQLVHWNQYESTQYRSQELIDFYNNSLRPFAMYRNDENASDWPDVDDKLGQWKEAFTGRVTNASGKLEE
ncbi:MAG: nitroreductase family protein [Chloroflexota bacterium]